MRANAVYAAVVVLAPATGLVQAAENSVTTDLIRREWATDLPRDARHQRLADVPEPCRVTSRIP